jgi:mono/diheme cytochrome c family protein
MKWSRKRLRPERGDGATRGDAAPPSESSRRWGPAGIEKCSPGRRSASIILFCVLVSASGCRQDMHNQPKYIPLRDSAFFKDNSSARPLPDDTVARGTLEDDSSFYTGKNGTAEVDALPFPLTQQVLDRGEDRFNIYCAPCHDRNGTGNGMIVRRGYRQPPSYHIDRLRQAPLGHFFDVMTNGFGAMPDYRAQIAARDRWAIAAYIRALQYSQNAAVADLTPDDRQKLSQPAPSQAEGAAKH